MTSDCPAGSADCGTSVAQTGNIDLNLGVGSTTGTSSGAVGSIADHGTSGSSMSASLSGQGASRATELYNAAMTKKYGSAYTKAVAAALNGRSQSAARLIAKKAESASASTASVSAPSWGNAQATPTATGSPLPIGADDKGISGNAGRGSSRSGRSGSRGSGQEQIPETDPSGLTQTDVNSMLAGSGDAKFNSNPDDELFMMITKRYIRSAYPALLKPKSKIESVQESKAKDVGGKETYSPWQQNLKRSDPAAQ